MPKCPHCNNEVKEEDAIYNTKTKRYYHEQCYNILLDRKVIGITRNSWQVRICRIGPTKGGFWEVAVP